MSRCDHLRLVLAGMPAAATGNLSSTFFAALTALIALALPVHAQTDPGANWVLILDDGSGNLTLPPAASNFPGASEQGNPGQYPFFLPSSGAFDNLVAGAYGTANSYCHPHEGGEQILVVECFNSAGTPTASSQTILAVNSANLKNISYAYAPANGAVDLSLSYNQNGAASTASGPPILGAHPSTGVYTVTFNGLSGSGGAVQVTSVSSTNGRCYANGWSSNLLNTSISATITIYCTNAAGKPEDTGYLVYFIPAGATPQNLGYAWASNATQSSYAPVSVFAYNPNGGAINFTRSAVGNYAATFAGAYAQLGGNVQVSAVNTNSGAVANYCKVSSWGTGLAPADLLVNVLCFDGTGAAADSQYSVLAVGPPQPGTQPVTAAPLTLTCSTTAGPTTVGVAYTTTCAASGGVPPYRFTSDFLPRGLSLTPSDTTVTISGTPTTSAQYNYSVYLQDASSTGANTKVSFSGAIALPPPSLSVLSPATAIAGGSANLTLAVYGNNFTKAAEIQWDGTAIPTTYFSATELKGTVAASQLAKPGTYSVTVKQPSVTGGTTDVVTGALTFETFSTAPAGTVLTALPSVNTNGIYSTVLYLRNLSTTPQPFTISFYDRNGNPTAQPIVGTGALNQITGVLPVAGSVRYEAGDPSQAQISGGWALVSADPTTISVQAVVRELDLADGLYFASSYSATPGGRVLSFPFDFTTTATGQQLSTIFTIVNMDAANTAKVTCQARGPLGRLFSADITVQPLPPLGSFPGITPAGLNGFSGTISCSSTTDVNAVSTQAIADPTGAVTATFVAVTISK